MASIGQHYEKVKVTLKESRINADLFVYIRSIEKELIEYNVNQINSESKDIFGRPIGFYSQATEIITGGEKKEGQPFTGYDTGKWLNSFFLRKTAGGFQFWARDKKTAEILKSPAWQSDDLFGLSDEDLSDAIKTYFLPYFLNYFRNDL